MDAQVHTVIFLVETAAACFFRQRLESWEAEATCACKTASAGESFKSLSRWMKVFIYCAYLSGLSVVTANIFTLLCIEIPILVAIVNVCGDLSVISCWHLMFKSSRCICFDEFWLAMLLDQ